MKKLTIGLCMVTVLVMVALPAQAQPRHRMWDNFGSSGIGSLSQAMFEEHWPGGGGDRFEWVSGYLNIKKDNDTFFRTLDLTLVHEDYNYEDGVGAVPSIPCAPPLGNYYNGTDDNPLILCWEIDDPSTGFADSGIQCELSMDGDHPPAAPYEGPPIYKSMAYGHYVNWGGSAAAKYFDGNKWVDTKYEETSLWPSKRFNIWRMTIKSTTFDLYLDAKKGYRDQEITDIPRGYLGGFNQVSIVMRANESKPMKLQYVYVSGGVLVREPIVLDMDIMPQDDPNLFTVIKKTNSKARLPIEIYGSEECAGDEIDLDSVKVAGVVTPVKMQNDTDLNGDGIIDLKVHLNRRALIDAMSLDAAAADDVVEVELTANRLSDDWPLVGTDSIVINLQGD